MYEFAFQLFTASFKVVRQIEQIRRSMKWSNSSFNSELTSMLKTQKVGVNFINVLQATFAQLSAHRCRKRKKDQTSCQSYCAFGRRTLMKLTLDRDFWLRFTITKKQNNNNNAITTTSTTKKSVRIVQC
jgi:hypothetical protein